jgi:prefoldin subunit 5
MNDHSSRISEAVDELAAQLDAADALITAQAERIESLEQLVADLRAVIAGNEAAA